VQLKKKKLTSDIVWDYFFKAVQRSSLMPKESAEFQEWYDALPQTQPKSSEAYQAWEKATPQLQHKGSEAYQAWEKASPSMQPKKSDAFREWLRTMRENASQRSVDAHQWFKSKPPTADTDESVKQWWYDQNPTLHKSRTGCDAKNRSGRQYGARVGASIGQSVGAGATSMRRAMEAAANSNEYQCRQCGRGYTKQHLKKNMVSHLSTEANRQCLVHYSESKDLREMEWVRLAQEQEAIDAANSRAARHSKDYQCRQCGCGVNKRNLGRNMVSHLSTEANRQCLVHYSVHSSA